MARRRCNINHVVARGTKRNGKWLHGLPWNKSDASKEGEVVAEEMNFMYGFRKDIQLAYRHKPGQKQ